MNCLMKKDLGARARRTIFLVSKLQRGGTISWSTWFLCTSWQKLYVALREILMGNTTILPEDAFRGVGSIEDVIAKAEKNGILRRGER